MVLSIMQPYLFPYIGYFQLIRASAKFVFYDDVNYIKGGWINRNKILVNGNEYLFAVPLRNISSFNLINKTEIDQKQYKSWHTKFLTTVEQNYKKSPFFPEIYELITGVFSEPPQYISELSKKSIISVASYLQLSVEFVRSSVVYGNSFLKSTDRILDICRKESASIYVNTIAGKDLYSAENFTQQGIQLKFLKPANISYRQFKDNFIPSLSIIDVMMFNPVNDIRSFLDRYELV